MGTVLVVEAVIESALDLTRPGRANEGDELRLVRIPARSTHDFFDPTGLSYEDESRSAEDFRLRAVQVASR
jgi:hypothetical protein